MTYLEFVKATICDLNPSVFEELKSMLVGEYISFSIIEHENVTADILAEKVCDYFCTLEIKTRRSFDKYIEIYMHDLETIVGPYIAKKPPARKDDEMPAVVPRSRKYYEKAIETRRLKEPSATQLIDYTRIMMCLYTAVMKNEGKPIDNFDYAAGCLEPKTIVDSVKSGEVNTAVPNHKKKGFNTREQYSDDVCTLIILILTLYSIVNGTVEGETVFE